MEDIKNFLEELGKRNWSRVKEGITAEAIDKVTVEDQLDSMLEKLDRCLEIQEQSIQTLERINEIISK